MIMFGAAFLVLSLGAVATFWFLFRWPPALSRVFSLLGPPRLIGASDRIWIGWQELWDSRRSFPSAADDCCNTDACKHEKRWCRGWDLEFRWQQHRETCHLSHAFLVFPAQTIRHQISPWTSPRVPSLQNKTHSTIPDPQTWRMSSWAKREPFTEVLYDLASRSDT